MITLEGDRTDAIRPASRRRESPPHTSPVRDLPRFGETVTRMLALAWPIMLGSIAMAVLHLGQIALLGNHADGQPLLLLSLLMPFFLLFMAFLEAVAVTAQVFSARSRRDWPGRNVLDATLVLAVLGLAIVGILAGGAHAWNLYGDVAIPFVSAEVLVVLPAYLVSLAPLILFETANGALRGQGRTVPGFLMLGLMVPLNLALCYLFVFEHGLGFEGVLFANFAAGLVVAPTALLVLGRGLRGRERGPFVQALSRSGLLLGIVGAPVFFSLAVSVFSSAVVVDLVAAFGSEQVSGFLIVARLRFFFLVPAIAFATALAVMVNQEHQSDDTSGRRALLRQGAGFVVLVYAVLTVALGLAHQPVVAVLAADADLRVATTTILIVLLPSFFLVGVVVAAQIVLENLGRGVRVLIWTVLLEAAACVALLTLAVTLEDALLILLAVAGAYGLAIALEYVLAVVAKPKAALSGGEEERDHRVSGATPNAAPAE